VDKFVCSFCSEYVTEYDICEDKDKEIVYACDSCAFLILDIQRETFKINLEYLKNSESKNIPKTKKAPKK
jgi:hypothetical protein